MFVNQKQGDVHGSDNGYAFWRDRGVIAERLEGLGGGVVELDDGIFSYALPSGAMSGFGLALDKEAFAAWNRAELLHVAYERGYRLLGVGWYMQTWPEEAFADPHALKVALSSLIGGSLSEWTFRPVYVERGGEHSFAFIEFAPAQAPSAIRPTWNGMVRELPSHQHLPRRQRLMPLESRGDVSHEQS
jgi:hypothetical protein